MHTTLVKQLEAAEEGPLGIVGLALPGHGAIADTSSPTAALRYHLWELSTEKLP